MLPCARKVLSRLTAPTAVALMLLGAAQAGHAETVQEIERRLEFLDLLHEQGRIGEEEFLRRQSKILDLLMFGTTEPGEGREHPSSEGEAATVSPRTEPRSDEPPMPAPQEEPVFVGTWSVEKNWDDYLRLFPTESTWTISAEDGQVSISEFGIPLHITSIEYDEDEILFTAEEQYHITFYTETTTTTYLRFISQNRAEGRFQVESFSTGLGLGHTRDTHNGTINMVRIRAEQLGVPGRPGLAPDAPPAAPDRQGSPG